MKILGGIFLGWSLGANDAANVFGTAVSSQMVRWRTATILIAVFVVLGAVVGGGAGLDTLGDLADQNLTTAFCATLAAALTVAFMTVAKLPVSTSQAVVGAIIGVGIIRGEVNLHGLRKVVICWIGTPVGAAVLACVIYPILGKALRAINPHFLIYDSLMRVLLILGGVYGAYALGANNVGNVTGAYYRAGVFGSDLRTALLVGGVSIALGALTYSKNVMLTVGRRIVSLDAFSAFVVVASAAVTLHFYALMGVPVSSSQAVVGAVIGIGVLKNVRTVSQRTVLNILLGWVATPAIGLVLALLLYRMSAGG